MNVATCTDDQDETFDALIRTNDDGHAEYLELAFVDSVFDLRAHDIDAFELVWEHVMFLLKRPPPEKGWVDA